VTASEGSYEDLTECGLSPDLEQELLNTCRNCVFMWTNSKAEPFGVVMSYLPKDGKLWLTAASRRKRIPALRRNPRASICVWGAGTELGSGRTITYKGNCIIHDDRQTKDWFYPEFARYLRGDTPQAEVFRNFLDSPDRVIIEFTPDYKLGFDSELMWARSPGAT
jgi:general stress protein 26